MKKSEALEKIKNKLWLLGVADLSDRDAESMLKFIEEELGMLPPLNRIKANATPSCFLKEFIDADNYYEWEPEDDI